MQCRMARSALSMSIEDLARLSGHRPMTISAFERGGNAYQRTVDALQGALEAAGVVFLSDGETSLSGGPGVRLCASG